MASIEDFARICGYPCSVLEDASEERLRQSYEKARERGESEGFTPVFVVWDDTLMDKLEVELEDGTADMRAVAARYVREAEGKSAGAVLRARMDGALPMPSETHDYDRGEKHHLEFDYIREAVEDEDNLLLLVEVPTAKPYEVLGYFPMGGFNDCPSPAEQIAVSRRWHESYRAVPMRISCDTVEYYVPSPPKTDAAVRQLAAEAFAFCVDSVEQGAGDLETLADFLYDNVQWYFWWD